MCMSNPTANVRVNMQVSLTTSKKCSASKISYHDRMLTSTMCSTNETVFHCVNYI